MVEMGFSTTVFEIDPPDFLRRFVRLTKASDVNILEFARRYGRLGECAEPEHPIEESCKTCSRRLPTQEFPDQWEPVSLWRVTSRAFSGALGLWADISQGNEPNQSECQELRRLLPHMAAPAPGERTDYTWLLREFVSARLRSQNLWLDLLRTETGFASVLFGRGTWAALALGLAIAITSVGFVRCDVCAAPYQASRHPRQSGHKYGPEQHYCSQRCREDGERKRQRAAYIAKHQPRRASAYRQPKPVGS